MRDTTDTFIVTIDFLIEEIKIMAVSGEIKKDMLFWKESMPEWKKGEEIDALKGVFVKIPPIPNSEA